MVQLIRELSEDAAGCRGCGLVFDDHLVDGLDVGGIVGGEDGDVGRKFCEDLVWGAVFLVDFDDGGSGSGHASVAKRMERIEVFRRFFRFLYVWGSWSGFFQWYLATRVGACTCPAGSHESSVLGYPFQ